MEHDLLAIILILAVIQFWPVLISIDTRRISDTLRRIATALEKEREDG